MADSAASGARQKSQMDSLVFRGYGSRADARDYQVADFLSNSSGIHAVPIAEHIIGFMFLFTRGFYDSFRNQERRIWQKKNDISELRSKTILIVGLGDIGREAARLAHTLGCRVIAVSRSGKEKPAYVAELKTADKLLQMLPQADFVVISAPYTRATHHWFAMREFRRMK